MNRILSVAAVSGLLAVALGAFGAHGLKAIISPEMLEVYKTGVQYQFYHAFALLIVGILMSFSQSKALTWSAYLFITGIILFSGSLYLLAISGVKALGMITPFGGITWIAAWLLMIVHFSRMNTSK